MTFKPCKFIVALIGVVLVTINTLILSLDILQSKVVIYNENACDLVNCWLRLLVLVGEILFLAVSNVDTQQWCQSLYKVLHWLITTLWNQYITSILIDSEWYIKKLSKISIPERRRTTFRRIFTIFPKICAAALRCKNWASTEPWCETLPYSFYFNSTFLLSTLVGA